MIHLQRFCDFFLFSCLNFIIGPTTAKWMSIRPGKQQNAQNSKRILSESRSEQREQSDFSWKNKAERQNNQKQHIRNEKYTQIDHHKHIHTHFFSLEFVRFPRAPTNQNKIRKYTVIFLVVIVLDDFVVWQFVCVINWIELNWNACCCAEITWLVDVVRVCVCYQNL